MYNKKQYEFATSKEMKESCNDLFKGNHWFNILLVILSMLYAFAFGYDGIVLALNIFSFGFFTYRFVLSLLGLKGDKTSDKKVKKTKNLPKYCILLPMRNEPIPVIKALVKTHSLKLQSLNIVPVKSHPLKVERRKS